MSQWTHVAGSIRFDALRGFGLPGQNPADWIGPTNLWEEDNEDSTIPAGSEGSLNYTVAENPEQSSLAAYSVDIFGDLRDFGREDVGEIEQWLAKITEGKMVRQGVIQVEVESGPTIIFSYDSDASKWLRMEAPAPTQ